MPLTNYLGKSDAYWATNYPQVLVFDSLLGLHATNVYRAGDGDGNECPFSLSQAVIQMHESKKIEFYSSALFIHADGATSLTIDGDDYVKILADTDVQITSAAISLAGALALTGAMTISSTLNVTGNVTAADYKGPVGSVTPDTGAFSTLASSGLSTLNSLSVTVNASIGGTLGVTGATTLSAALEVAGDVSPNADDTHDLGAVGKEWRNLYIDGIANIDSLIADTADINGGTIDGTTFNSGVIGGVTPANGTFTTLYVDTEIFMKRNDLNLDADGHEKIVNGVDGRIDIYAGSAAQIYFKDGSFEPVVNNDVDIGSVGSAFKDGYFVGTLNATTIDNIDTLSTNGGATISLDGQVTINWSALAFDFIVKGENDTKLIYVDASEDKVGIGTSVPSAMLDIVSNHTAAATTMTLLSVGRDYVNAADDDEIYFDWYYSDSAAALVQYARMGVVIQDITETTKDADIFFSVIQANSLIEVMRLDSLGNVGIGVTDFDIGRKVLGLGNGTVPTAHVDNQVLIYSVDSSNLTATLGLFLEEAVITEAAGASDRTIPVLINGVEYKILLKA